MSFWKWDKAGLFVGGMLFATKGIEALALFSVDDEETRALVPEHTSRGAQGHYDRRPRTSG